MAEVSSTFIVRLWITDDPLTDRPPHGRGRIDHLQSGERIYFDQLEPALAFIRQHFGAFESMQPADPSRNRHNQETYIPETTAEEDHP